MTCPNGHANPDYQQYCGECGAPLVVTDSVSPLPAGPAGGGTSQTSADAHMVRCPNGHENPEHQQFCGECGGPLVSLHSGPPANPGLPQQLGQGPGYPPSASSPVFYPSVTPQFPRVGVPRWLWITAAASTVVALVVAVAVYLAAAGSPSISGSELQSHLAVPLVQEMMRQLPGTTIDHERHSVRKSLPVDENYHPGGKAPVS